MKYVVGCCVLSALSWFGCTVSAESSLQTDGSDALLANVAHTLCVPDVLRAAETAALQGAISEADATAVASGLPEGYEVISTSVKGQFSSVETPVDPGIDLKIRDQRFEASFWARFAFDRPRLTGMPSAIARMFLQDNLFDDVGRECIPERNAGGIIVDAFVSEEIDTEEHLEHLCLERNEAPAPVILNGARPLTDNSNGTQSIRVPGSMSDSGDVDAFSINIRDEFWTIPVDGRPPRVVIEVTPDDNSLALGITSIAAHVDCGDKTPRMICADGLAGTACRTDDSSLEVEIGCFIFSGIARLDIELAAAADVMACVPYQLSVTVQ